MEPVPWGDEPIVHPGAFGAPGPFGAAPTMEDFEPKGYRLYRRDWSDGALRSAETLHLRALSRGEKDFLVLQRNLFDQQKAEVITALNVLNRKSLVEKQMHNGMFDLAKWIRDFIVRALPFYRENVDRSANANISAYRLNINFDPGKEGVRNWLRDRTEFWAQRVNEETARLLNDERGQGIEAGESIKQLQERVEKVFRFSNVVRSEMIARTETQAAVNHGAYESYVQSGVVESKMWLATLDDRTRLHHLEAHRQIVPLEAKFEVGGELLQHPGDGSPRNAIQCRCTLVPIIGARKALPKQSLETGGMNGSRNGTHT